MNKTDKAIVVTKQLIIAEEELKTKQNEVKRLKDELAQLVGEAPTFTLVKEKVKPASTTEQPFTYWKDYEIDRLKSAVNLGKNDFEIAELLGRSKSAITAKRNILKLPVNRTATRTTRKRKYEKNVKEGPWTNAEFNKLKEMTEAGRGPPEIGKELNRSMHSVWEMRYKIKSGKIAKKFQPKKIDVKITSQSDEQARRAQKKELKDIPQRIMDVLKNKEDRKDEKKEDDKELQEFLNKEL